MLKYLLGRMLSREIWHLSDVAVKNRRRKKAMQKYFEEEKQKNDLVLKGNLLKFSSHIEITDRFLRDSVKLEQLVEDKRRLVKAFFEHNRDTKIYRSFFLTTPQKEELNRLLSLKPADYIMKDIRRIKTEQNTVEFILEQTSTYKKAVQIVGNDGHRMFVDAQMATIYFPVVFR